MSYFLDDAATLTIELPQWFPLVGTAIALVALLIAFLNFRRKSGLAIRGNFSWTTSMFGRDRYVSQVILENLKDRGVTIYAIYLRVGPNYYIELENFDGKSLILKAYETYQQDFGPIQFYASNGRKLLLDILSSDRSVKKQLVLSTSHGKYVVPRPLRAWSPVANYFANPMTAVVTPRRLLYKDRSVGSRVKFVVDIETMERQHEVVMLTSHASEYRVFNNFQLTKDALTSSHALEEFLGDKISTGELEAASFKVFDTSLWSKPVDVEYDETIDAKKVSWLKYFIVGRAMSWMFRMQIKKRIKNNLRKKIDK